VDADLAKWQERYAQSTDTGRVPSPWIMEQCRTLPSGALILDVAAGLGRHAIPLAAGGWAVLALDFVERAVRSAAGRQERVLGLVADARALPLRDASVDAIVCAYYLDRAAFPVFARLLRPGGRLIVETYTRRHLHLIAAGRARGPRDPRILLESGELPHLVGPLRLLASYEGLVEEGDTARYTAGIVAAKDRALP
jgi:SAM-dependent methyltransferase